MVVQKPDISPELRHLLNELQTINLNSSKSRDNKISPSENLTLPSEADKTEAKTNTKNEETILDYAEHFRQQYMYLYRDRQPLFLTGENEALTKKFVSTSLRPSLVNHDELYSWQGCAEFVSDCILPRMLETPTELPNSLNSPIEVLRRQEGHCFEMAGLLASLLLGAGYDAFVVSGYATREICLADKTRIDTDVIKQNPALEEIDTEWDKQFPEVPRKKTRYIIRPVKDLTSKFDQKMKDKEIRKNQDKINKERNEILKKQMLAERPSEDELYGVRIHSWVLIRPGRREVPKAFFIDPFSGQAFSQDCDELLGIESIYNHKNYYVCMQDCSEGCVTLNWDINDPVFWESLLPHKFEELVNRNNDEDSENGDEIEEEDDSEDEDENSGENKKNKAIQMPESWVSEIEISREMYETRCPSGKRTFYFKRAKLDKYAPYLRPDGMTQQLSLFDKLDYHIDLNSNLPKEIREWFSNRVDCLNFRIHDKNTDWVCETFNKGRSNYALRKHKFNLLTPQASAPRTLYFYNNARSDGLFSRHISSKSMVEKYINRSDRLILRVIEYANHYNKPVVDKKKLQSADFSQQRPIVQITDQFSSSKPNLDKDDDPEIAELVYYLNDEEAKIHVTYHRTSDKISPCTRQFEKPSIGHQVSSDTALTGTGSIPAWDEELCQSYSNEIATDRAGSIQSIKAKETQTSGDKNKNNSDDFDDKPSHRELFSQLKELMVQEVHTIASVRTSEEETAELLKERQKESLSQELNISIYDTRRNLKAKKRREELERQAKEDAERRNDHSMDFLAPFLCKMGISDTSVITPVQAQDLYKDCLNDMKTRLVNMANLIQERFDMETKELERRQARYQVKQVHITKEEEEEYVNYCADATFRIHILETRLNEHKKKAPVKYSDLEKKIRNDPRLAKFF